MADISVGYVSIDTRRVVDPGPPTDPLVTKFKRWFSREQRIAAEQKARAAELDELAQRLAEREKQEELRRKQEREELRRRLNQTSSSTTFINTASTSSSNLRPWYTFVSGTTDYTR